MRTAAQSADDRADEAADQFTRGFDMSFGGVACAAFTRLKIWIACIVFLGTPALAFARAPVAQAQLVCSGSNVIPGVLAKCPPPDSSETPDDGLPSVPESQLRDPLTYDEELAAIAARVPAFGGGFVDEKKKVLFIYMKPSNAGGAQGAPAAQLAAAGMRKFSPLLDGMQTKVLKARYGFGQLKRWKDRMAQLFRIRGVTSVDIEDSRNRLDVGLQHSRIRPAVERRLARLGIPQDAVRFQRRQPTVADSSLGDRHRPLVAGLSITKRQLANGLYPTCTLGFVAWSQRQGRWGFVTNSHCTDRRGGVESTDFWQPFLPPGRIFTQSSTPYVGREADDPAYYGCYAFWSCRYSDSAFIAFPDWFGFGSSYELGGIPDPVFGCCTTAYDQNRRGAFIGETHPPEGHGVCKTGQTTGPTCGAITDTCDDSFMQGGYVYRCQFTAAYGRDGGDSGAPVWVGVAPAQAYLVGMHHGAQGGDGSFSPIGNIQRGGELGFLWNCRDFRC